MDPSLCKKCWWWDEDSNSCTFYKQKHPPLKDVMLKLKFVFSYSALGHTFENKVDNSQKWAQYITSVMGTSFDVYDILQSSKIKREHKKQLLQAPLIGAWVWRQTMIYDGLDKIASKIKSRQLASGDFWVVDWAAWNVENATVILGTRGQVERAKVLNWFVQSLPNVIPQIASLKTSIHPVHGYNIISADVTFKKQIRPFKGETASLVKVGDFYVSKEDNSIWKPKKAGSKKVLERIDNAEVSAFLPEHVMDPGFISRYNLPWTPLIEQGDIIRWEEEGSLKEGQLVSWTPGQLIVKETADSMVVVAEDEVVDWEPETDETEFLINFFTQIYGDEDFAKKLVLGTDEMR